MDGEALAGHERFMRAALAYGRRSMGRAAPNPAVGALVVRDGIVIGRGATAPGGRPHAEPIALAGAGDGARGATLYVTLEPCSHFGRTPPCVDAVRAAGIARVVVGLLDPDPRVAGQGLEALRDSGVAVIGPVLPTEARRDHLGHVLRVTLGRPKITVKMAETADGFAASRSGDARLMITDAAANGQVQMLRALHDAVLVGRGTAIEDDPLLTVRLPGFDGHRPRRIVVDSDLSLPLGSQLVRTIEDAPLMIVTAETVASARAEAVERLGASVLRLPRGSAGIDLSSLALALGRLGLTRVLCEGGPKLASALIEQGLADEVVLITSAVVHAAAGRPALGPQARSLVADPAAFTLRDEVQLGPDRMRTYERIETACSPDL